MKTSKLLHDCAVHQRFAKLMQAIMSPSGYGSLNVVATKCGKSKALLSQWANGKASPILSSLELPEIGWTTQDFIEALASPEDPVILVQRKKKVVHLHPHPVMFLSQSQSS